MCDLCHHRWAKKYNWRLINKTEQTTKKQRMSIFFNEIARVCVYVFHSLMRLQLRCKTRAYVCTHRTFKCNYIISCTPVWLWWCICLIICVCVLVSLYCGCLSIVTFQFIRRNESKWGYKYSQKKKIVATKTSNNNQLICNRSKPTNESN